MYFVGGELAVVNRLFFDPPMHKECAEFSLKVCPFLAFKKGYREDLAKLKDQGVIVNVDPNMHTGRCKKFGLLGTDGYKLHLGPGGKKYLRPHKAISLVWHEDPHFSPVLPG